MSHQQTIFRIPGSVDQLVYERNADGRLLRLSGGGRVYVEAGDETRTVYDDDFVTSVQTELPGGLLRTMRANGHTWIESFAWDAKGLLTEIDGVIIGYDDQQRIVSCRGAGGEWIYAYSGPHLAVIDGSHGLRQITRAEDGRPLSVRTKSRTIEILYDAGGTRLLKNSPLRNWNRDASGRLWTITDDDGNILLTYIWDRYQCLGCIAGSVGDPLSSVYSLDLTGTPIRVVTRDSVRRIPRDAFGESLLQEQDVPGLFCGAISDGLVYLPFRRLDPFTGSFDAPDPMDGEKTDPRRAAGYSGPLAVELPASGPYTVCRNNPMSLADPTGAISDYWWLIPSSLTWSLQNTIGSLLGMWLNLEMSPLGMIASAAAIAATTPQGGVFDIEGISANNFDSFAIRSDGWLARLQSTAGQPTTRTWTYQFLVNAPGVNFTNLEHARVFAPDARFQPRLYGTVLYCDPADSPSFVMRGQRTPPNGAPLLDWSRNGGTAEPVIPGSFVPAFPSGGLHFGNVQRGVGQQSGELVELEPSGSVLNGTISQRALLTLDGTGFGLATNGLVLLSTSSTVVEVARVLDAEEENGKTLVRVDTAGAGLGTSGIRLEGLSALVGTENLTPVAGQTQRLNLVGSSNDYRPNATIVRMNRAGAVVGADKVSALEAQLAVDEALPSTLGNTLRVRPAVATGNFNGTLTGNANVLRIVSGTVPGAGTGVVVGPAASAIAAIVQSVSGQDVTVDRALTPLGGDGTVVNWQNLAPLPAVGQRAGAPETQQQITYTPDRAGTAPSTGFVWVEGTGIATRRVTALNYDAIVLSQALPDTNPAAFSVDRFTLQAPDVGGISATAAQTLALNAAPPASARAFHVIELAGAALAAGTNIVTASTLTGDTAQVTIDPNAAPTNLVPGQIVILQSGASLEAAAVLRLRLTITLSRNLTLNANGLEAVLLGPTGPTYNAVRRGDRTFRVLPSANVAGAPIGTDLPRFAIGEIVRVVLTSSFTFTPAVGLAFALGDTMTVRITNAAGNNIDYTFEINDGVAPLTTVTNTTNAPNAPAGTIGIAVVSDPATQTAQQTISAIITAMTANGFLVTNNTDGGFEVNHASPIVSATVTGTANGELIAAASERLYRVQFVNGTTLTGADDEAIIPPSVTNLTVVRLDVLDPGTGSSRLGIDGESLPSSQVRFNVWRPAAFDFWTGTTFNFNNNRLGIVDGQNVFAVRPGSGNQTLDITFLTAPTLAAPVTLTLPAQAAVAAPATTAGPGFSARFTLDGASLIFLDTPLTSALTGLILTVPYIETTRRVNGSLNSGKVRVPNDHENASIELDRRQALEDHELTHTHQSARLGPWLFAYFPLWIVEMIVDLATSAGGPEFGRYVPATVGADSITIPAVSGVTINTDDYVQVAQSGRAEIVKLGAKTGDVYSLNREMMQKLAQKNIVAGPAQARREESGGVEWGEWIVNIMQLMTVGGLMNQIAVLGWGGVIWLITMFIQWIRGMARNTVTAQLAADHITLTLAQGDRVEGVSAGSLLALQAGNQTFVRPVQTVADRSLVLATAVPFANDVHDVRISAYSTSSALFPNWHDYYPATFPDVNRPASLQVQRVGNNSLTLAVDDRVHIRSSGGHGFNTVVTFAGDNGLIEVEDETLVHEGETEEYFIAKIGEDDPMGFTDQFLLNQLHLGWMQYIHDPWGQIVYRAKPTSLAGKIFARSARYLFGTQGWSVLPAFGYFWYDNAFQQANAQRSHMEQEASHRSGDTYCPIGSLHGELTVVGDVTRYWLTEDGGLRDTDPPQDMLTLNQQDAPGSNAQQFIAVTPATTAGLPAGLFVSDIFSQVDGNLALNGVSNRGWIPVNATLERTSGAFVAFTRPGSHTITGQSLSNLASANDAQANGFPEIISFTRTVADVTVTLSNLPVADSSGTPIDLIPFQRALFAIAENGNRVYRATLLESGAIATIENNLELVMQGIAPAAAPGGLSTENVEISRFYRFNATANAFDSGLTTVNVPADIDVAVRRLQIRLVDTVPLRATDNPADPAITNLLPGGTGVLLIPAPFLIAAITTAVTGTPALTPDFTAPASVPANTQAFVRDGGVVNVAIRANDPPEAAATLTITIPVGPSGSTTVPVTCQITVNPHFTLDSATGFNLTAGNPLTLRSSDNTNIALVGTLTGIDAVANNDEITLTLTTAPPGPVIIVVADTSNNQRMARRTITVA